jgi:hypothetical protein
MPVASTRQRVLTKLCRGLRDTMDKAVRVRALLLAKAAADGYHAKAQDKQLR